MELWELIARELIRETLARYAHYADSGRFDELAALFAENGILEIDGREPLHGRAAIHAFLSTTKRSLAADSTQPYIRHHVSSVTIDVHSATTASARSYFLAITDRGPDHWGRYRDGLVCIEGKWLFERRRVRPDGHTVNSWRATRTLSP